MKKRLKKKKISGKRLVRIMEQKCKSLSDALEFQKEQIRKQHRIIRKLGSKDGYEFLDKYGEKTVEAKLPMTFGNYVVTDELNDKIIEGCERELVASLVRGLMEVNAVQFIVREGDSAFYDYNTVAAKLRVVPWYEAVKPNADETH